MKTITCACAECSTSFQKSETEIERSKSGNHFCSNGCSNKYRSNIRKSNLEKIRLAYANDPSLCGVCKSKLPWEKRHNKFCGHACSATYTNNKRGPMAEKIKNKISVSLKKSVIPRLDEKMCPVCKSKFLVGRINRKKQFCCKKCADVGKDVSNNGGYREKGGRGKQGWYKGYYCNSSWELAWVIYSLEHNLKFKRNTQGFFYNFNGKTRNYYPDFLKEDGEYVEIKGYNSKQWEAKKSQFQHQLSILDKKTIKPYISYVIEKYGKDYIRLYEK